MNKIVDEIVMINLIVRRIRQLDRFCVIKKNTIRNQEVMILIKIDATDEIVCEDTRGDRRVRSIK